MAVRTYVVGVVSPVAGTERTSHFPAKSARLTGAGPGAGVLVVLAVEEAVVSTAALSFLAQAVRTAALQQIAMRVVRCSVNMEPPCEVRDESRGAMPSRANVSLRLCCCKR